MGDKRNPFAHPRYATRGVLDCLDPTVQQELWLMVDLLCTHRLVKPDYLQVFDLKPDYDSLQFNQSIRHHQECPPYSATNALRVKNNPVAARVFVIDDDTHCTMMLADEY